VAVDDIAFVLAAIGSRAATGTLIAAAIAVTAWKARALSAGGAVAAVVVGSICAAAGWDWGGMLIAFFLTSTLLGRIRSEYRARRIEGIVAKGGARDARQVLANGGIFAIAALGSLVSPSPGWLALGGGALATAASDTWATEIGSLAPGSPRHIFRGHPVPPGTSGAVSVWGSLASLAGALVIGGAQLIADWPPAVIVATVLGGVVGALIDSGLGATVQHRRWCDRCNSGTEQAIHGCGSATRAAGGVAWIDNDAVNLLSVLAGAATALILFAVQGLPS